MLRSGQEKMILLPLRALRAWMRRFLVLYMEDCVRLERDDEPGNASLESVGCVEDSKDVSCEGPGDVELTNPVSCINQIKQWE